MSKQIDPGIPMSRDQIRAMYDNYNQFLTNSIVRKNTTLSDASEVKNSIYLIKKNSHGSQDIIQLTDELYTK